MWMAGGGIKGGVSVGETDELGSAAVDDRFHVKHLHATVLHQMGFDPNRLTLLLQRPGPEAGRRRRRRADQADHLNKNRTAKNAKNAKGKAFVFLAFLASWRFNSFQGEA